MLTWSLSSSVWVWTTLATVAVVVLVGAVGWFQYDAPFVPTVVRTATSPQGVLAAFLSGRAMAFVHCQRSRDRAMARGTTTLNSNVSLASVVTVASYTIVGLIATGVAMPILYEVSGSFLYLAAGIAIVATPIGFLLLVYQLTELIAADRYRRGYHVMPAAWFYVATLPWVVLAWMVLAGQATIQIPIPPEARAATSLLWAERLTADAWAVAFSGLCAPTALAYTYIVRRQLESVGRMFSF